MPQERICEDVKGANGKRITLKTLHKYFRAELDEGKARANAIVGQHLFKQATSSGSQSVTAAIFWLKCQAGWRETIANIHLNLPNDSEAAREIAGRLVPELANGRKAPPSGETQPERSDDAAVRVASVLGTNGTARANGHA
jgi:hypothetical protein